LNKANNKKENKEPAKEEDKKDNKESVKETDKKEGPKGQTVPENKQEVPSKETPKVTSDKTDSSNNKNIIAIIHSVNIAIDEGPYLRVCSPGMVVSKDSSRRNAP